MTFDSINHRSSLCAPHHHPKTASALSNIGDLTHISQIISNVVSMACPHSKAPVTPSHPHTASSTSSTHSPTYNTPSKLSQFLMYVSTSLNVDNACLHKNSLQMLGFSSDILHLIEDAVLKDIRFTPGDVICLKQNLQQWWSTNAKCKWAN